MIMALKGNCLVQKTNLCQISFVALYVLIPYLSLNELLKVEV